jgi:hypothetical protein
MTVRLRLRAVIDLKYQSKRGGKAHMKQIILVLCLLLPSVAFAQCQNFAKVRCVDGLNSAGWAGKDWGAWLNAADADLGSSPGEIWLATAGLTATTPITLHGNHVVRIIQPGQYDTSAMITLTGQASGITAPWTGGHGGGVSNNSPYYIKETAGANLPAVIKMTGTMNFVNGITVDGNENPAHGNNNNPCPSPPCYGIWVYKVLRASIVDSNVQQVATNGIRIESSHPFSGHGNESAASSIRFSQSVFSGGSAIKVTDTADASAQSVEAGESNIGLDLVDAGTFRVIDGDYGGNTQYGISVTCTGPDAGTGGVTLSPKQLGTNRQHQIYINAWTGRGAQKGAACTNGVLHGGYFITGGGPGFTPNAWDAVYMQDTGGWAITGNLSTNVNGGVPFRNGVEVVQIHTTEGTDVITGNNFEGVATTGCVLLGTTISVGNSSNMSCPTQNFYAAFDSAAQAANIGPTPLYTVPAPAAPLKVFISAVVTTAGTVSSTLPTACVLWTDADSNGKIQQIFNVTASGLTNTSNTTSTVEFGSIPFINAKAGTTVNYAFGAGCPGGSAYATSGATAMVYSVHVKVGAP